MAKEKAVIKRDNRKFRMLRVKEILERDTDETHSITMTQLLELLNEEKESDRRTLYKDIRNLDYFGTIVNIDKSKTPPQLYVDKRTFSISELKLMIDAIASSKFLTHSASQQLIDKLKKFCSRYQASELNRQTLIANRAKRIDPDFHNNVGIISQAIDKNRKVSFRYFRFNTKNQKEFNKNLSIVSPWSTIYTEDNYYLIAFDKDKIKYYRIDRMTDVVIIQNEKREGSEAYKKIKEELPFRTQSSFNLFGGEKQYVTLRCPAFFYYIIQDKFGNDLLAHPVKGTDQITVDVPVAVGDQFFGWIFSMGGKITIQGPTSVKKKMSELIEKVGRAYKY